MKTIAAVLAVLGLISLAGCNTIQGIGKDMQKAGEKIEDAARKK